MVYSQLMGSMTPLHLLLQSYGREVLNAGLPPVSVAVGAIAFPICANRFSAAAEDSAGWFGFPVDVPEVLHQHGRYGLVRVFLLSASPARVVTGTRKTLNWRWP